MKNISALLKRVINLWTFGRKENQSVLADVAIIRARFEQALQEESEMGWRHKSDSYYTDLYTGHNVGTDELKAVVYAKAISLEPTGDEIDNAGVYLERLVADLEEVKDLYRKQETDPDGYGIGTLHSLTKKLVEPFGIAN